MHTLHVSMVWHEMKSSNSLIMVYACIKLRLTRPTNIAKMIAGMPNARDIKLSIPQIMVVTRDSIRKS